MEFLEVPNQVYKGLKTDSFEMDHFRHHKKRRKGHGSNAPMISQAQDPGSLTSVPYGQPSSVSGSETPIADMNSPDINVAPDYTQAATSMLPNDQPVVSDGSDVDDGTNTFENHLNIFQRAGRYASKEAKQAAKFAKKEIGTIAGAAALLPLLPLKPMMIKILNKKGVKRGNTLKDVVNAFYNNVIKPHPIAKANTFDYPEHDLDNYTENNIIDVAIDIVEQIISFIKSLKSKAAKGGLLTDIEKDIVGGSDDALSKIDKKKGKGKGGHAKGLSGKPMNMKFIGIGAGVLVLIILLVVIFRKK